MKKFINQVENVELEMLEGIAKAHPQQLKKLPDFNVLVRAEKKTGKVALISGGGSGHEPAHGGFVGTGMLDAAVAGAGRSLGYVNAPSLFQRVCAECAGETADISIYETNKNLLTKGLRELGYHVVEPQGTFYIFPRTLIPDDIAFCEKAKDFNLLIVPGTGFGCPGHTRISFCVPTERVERALEAFKKLAEFYK